MNWETFPDFDALSEGAARILLDAIRADPKVVLGLPTGNTPLGMYSRIVAACSREYRCFAVDARTARLSRRGIPNMRAPLPHKRASAISLGRSVSQAR